MFESFRGVFIVFIGALLIAVFSCASSPKEVVVAIQPIEVKNEANITLIRKAIEKYYGCRVHVLEPIKMPKAFFINVKSPRYRADSIIRHFRRTKPDSISYILAYTSFDISCTKHNSDGSVKQPEAKYKDWGIFGLGFRPGPSCVVSDFRIKGINQAQTQSRLTKICLHELGHNLGLKHCSDAHCFMRDAAESIKTIDQVELSLCERCKGKVF